MSSTEVNISENAVEGSTVSFSSHDSDWEKEDCDTPEGMILGEKGALAHETTEDPVLDLFFKLVRDLSKEESFQEEYLNLLQLDSAQQVANAIVLAFQTRNCRGGKGERDLFNIMFEDIYDVFPETAAKLMPLIPEYGYWKDLLSVPKSLLPTSMRLFADQLKKDSETEGSISLCAKWAPREKGHFYKYHKCYFNELVAAFTGTEYPSFVEYQSYRKAVTRLCKKLDVTEQKMCANTYAQIDYAKVPSLHLAKWKLSHLNEKADGELRYPDREDRMIARQNLLSKKKLKGKCVNPHQITSTLHCASEAELQIAELQWADILTQFRGGKRSYIPISDVSGSMNGVPMEVSIALGVLLSMISHPSFADLVLTFHDEPSWVNLKDCVTLAEKVAKLREAPWGGSTNLIASFALIVQKIREYEIPPEEIPDLVIFSDMQFDEIIGSGSMATHLVTISQMFEQYGLQRPRIVFWNLRACEGVPAMAEHENVVLMSGYSPSLLKYLIFDESVEVTPRMTFDNVINDKMYDKIRDILYESNEGCLAGYTRPVEPSELPADEDA